MDGIISQIFGHGKIGEIKGNASCEGGDVILAGEVAFIGHSSRTNEEGIRQLKNILENIGYDVRVATVAKPFLHLGGMMSIVGNTILHCHHEFPDGFFDGFEEIIIECDSFIGGNVIYTGKRKVIVEKKEIRLQEKNCCSMVSLFIPLIYPNS